MLEGVSSSHVEILDLRGEGGGTWKARNGFGGRPWVLCTIGGFGGKRHFSGWMSELAKGVYEAAGTKGMSGIGAVMEGSDFNDAPYQFLVDLTWREAAPNVADWCADYARRRYGAPNQRAESAWRVFSRSVYALPGEFAAEGEPESVLCARPALKIDSASSWGSTKRRYRFSDLYAGWQELLAAHDVLQDSDAYRYDLVDVTRQVLSDWGQIEHERMAAAFKRKDLKEFSETSDAFLKTISDMDRLLGTRKEFLLGTWISQARALGRTEQDKNWLEWNARTQITTWANGGEAADLRDYANKEWSGLLDGFYLKRWQLWVAERKKELAGQPYKEIDWFPWEFAWNRSHDAYSSEAHGNEISEARRIDAIYGHEIEAYLGPLRAASATRS
jgi:alpha-N-acetylglucosaminidase